MRRRHITEHEAWAFLLQAIEVGALEDSRDNPVSKVSVGCTFSGLCSLVSMLRAADAITYKTVREMYDRIHAHMGPVFGYMDQPGRFLGATRNWVVEEFVRQTRGDV